MRRWLVRIFLLLLALVVLAVAGGWLALHGSLATLDGEQPLAGLAAPVTIGRDAQGSVIIDAGSPADAMRALGFAHAQERYFEMDLLRRSAAGELAALFGAMALDSDRAMRVHRLRARAREVLAAEPPERRALVIAYSEGVNAGLDQLAVRPWPYLLLRQQPVAWREEDSALAAFAMFVDLQDERNARELGWAQVAAVLAPDVVALLRLEGTGWDAPLFGEPRGEVLLPASLWGQADGSLPPPQSAPCGPDGCASGLRAGAEAAEMAAGSNSFAVSGALTADGRAIVANDMHLGLRVPALWMRARLRYADPQAEGGRVDVSGVSLPGVPGIVAGSNGAVAWGFTNSYGDWVDWFQVHWVGEGRQRYRTAEGEEQATRIEERIEVAGGEAELLEVLATRWGPVATQGPGGVDLALAWTAHRAGALDFSLLDMARVRSTEDALALGRAAGMPAQNLLAGDRDGRIGWTLAGRVPRRTGDCDPQLPMDPRGGCGWSGWYEPADVPALVDPPHGRLWTANARVVDGAALAMLGDGGYALGARQQQIRDALLAGERFDEPALLDLQLDDRALFLERWWQLLREVLEAPEHSGDEALQSLSRASAVWNGRASVDSASYRIARAFRLEVHERLLERALAPAVEAFGEAFEAPYPTQFEGVAWALVSQRPPQWPPGEAIDWSALLAEAARGVAEGLSQRGADLSLRTWGERNTAAIRHPLGGALPGFLARHLDMPPEPLPGDAHMPRVQGPAFGASERFVVAPGEEERGILHLPGGPTGHPLSPFHGAGHQDWVQGRPSPFLPGPAVHVLRLHPPGS